MSPRSPIPELTPQFVAETLALKNLAPILQGSPRPKGATEIFSVVTTDSRKIKPGSLFVAIPGEKFDGHEFIPAAIAQGARGILCRRDVKVEPAPGVFLFQVEDTVAAFRKLAAAWRKRFPIPVVAIAGSVGKTTTKELLAAILRGRWEGVLKTQGSQNGFLGIPMTLLELRESHGAAVVEVGIDEIGAMEQHMPLVSPTVALLTAIGPEHLEKLRDVPTVAREEGIALTFVSHVNGTAVVNLDDPWIRPHMTTLRGGKKIAFTLSGDTTGANTVCGRVSGDGGSLEVSAPGFAGFNGTEPFPMPLPGNHNARNLLAAITVAVSLGLSAEQIRAGLATFQGAEGRSELRELPGRTPVVCDYYNAQPVSMEAGFELLSQVASREGGKRRRWACLGDMLELGPDEEKFHRGLADSLTSQGIEGILLYGPRMRWLEAELRSRGYAGDLAHFETHSEMASALTSRIRRGEAVLIKGSRGMKMEELWKLLEAHAREHWV